MRTTVTLDPDNDARIQRRMRERGETFKQALNSLLREGGEPRHFRTPTAPLGRSTINLDRALGVAGDLEDQDLIRRMRSGG
ncbi:MAG: hypothetical protein U0R64_10065 [Candidatus Nanopelagicales bacterium]